MSRIVSVMAVIVILAQSIIFSQTTNNTIKQPSTQLSLKQAIVTALENNTLYRNAVVEVQISSERVNDAAARSLPKISGAADVRWNIARQAIVIPNFAALARPRTAGESTTIADTALVAGALYSTALQVDVQQPIFDASIGAEVAVSKTNQQLADANAQKARIELVSAVSRAYYTVLLNQEKLRQAETNATRTENFYKDVKSRFDNANALKTDVSRAYLEASNATQKKRQAQDALRLSVEQLATQLGLPVDNAAAFVLTDKLFVEGVDSGNNSLCASIEAVMQARIDVKTEVLQREANSQQLQKTFSQNLPTVSAYGTAALQGLGNSSFPGDFFPFAYVGVRVNVPISDWFTRTPLVQQQSLQVNKQENTLRALRQTVEYEVHTAQANLANAAQNLTLQRENIAIAEELVATATSRYKQGVARNQDVLDAEATLRDTQTAYLQSLYDFLIARLDWEKATGKL